MQVQKLLQQHYGPGMQVLGSQYPPAPWRAAAAQVCGCRCMQLTGRVRRWAHARHDTAAAAQPPQRKHTQCVTSCVVLLRNAQVVGLAQMGALGGVVFGERLFEAAGVPVPPW